jgi:ParB family chromosome partitioning protein
MDESFSAPGLASTAPASDRDPSGPDSFSSQVALKQAKLDLMHPDPKIRMLAIRCLEKAEPDIALPLLREMLADRDPEVRVQGLRSLVTFRDPSLFEVIKKQSTDGDPRMRVAALRGLFKQKERIDLNLLHPFLNDESPWVRRKLATLLGWSPQDGTFPILMRLSKDPHAKVRQAALLSLMTLYPAESQERLLETMNDPDVDLRKWAKDVLERSVGRSGS